MKDMIKKTNEMYYICPYCNVAVSLVLNLHQEKNDNSYTEDCINCRNPLHISYKKIDNQITNFKVEAY